MIEPEYDMHDMEVDNAQEVGVRLGKNALAAELLGLCDRWKRENGDYPESKRDCADDVFRVIREIDALPTPSLPIMVNSNIGVRELSMAYPELCHKIHRRAYETGIRFCKQELEKYVQWLADSRVRSMTLATTGRLRQDGMSEAFEEAERELNEFVDELSAIAPEHGNRETRIKKLADKWEEHAGDLLFNEEKEAADAFSTCAMELRRIGYD